MPKNTLVHCLHHGVALAAAFGLGMYAILRIREAAAQTEVDPTLVLATAPIGYFVRMTQVGYACAFVGIAGGLLARSQPVLVARVTTALAALSASVGIVQIIVAP